MKPIKLYVDMDDTINDMSEHFFHYAQEAGYVSKHAKYKQYDEYDLRGYFQSDISPEIGNVWIDNIFRTPGFWRTIPIKPHVRTSLMALDSMDEYEILFVTKPWDDSCLCLEEKREWVRDHFPEFNVGKQVIFMNNKSLLVGKDAIMIEDNPEYISSWYGDLTIVMNNAYNLRAIPVSSSYIRVDNWKQIIDFLFEYRAYTKGLDEVIREWKKTKSYKMVQSYSEQG